MTKFKTFRHFKLQAGVSAFVIATVLATTGVAHAQYAKNPNKAIQLNIVEQSLSEALLEFGVKTGISIAFIESQLDGLDAPKLMGSYSSEEALMKLLAGSGFTYEFMGEDAVQLVNNGQAKGFQKISYNMMADYKEEMAVSQDDDAADEYGNEYFEEVVVTATKRSTNLQDTAMSITAVGSEQMEMLSAVDFIDFVGSIPGISYISDGATGGQSGGRGLSLRGLAATSGAETVGFYIDEVPMTFTEPKMFDVARVEVLRGPQGTLYGASSMGGTIRVITNQPDLDGFEGKADVTYSNTRYGGGNTHVNLMLNLPVVEDKLAIRAVGTVGHESGYVDNIAVGHAQENYNDTDNVGGRITALFKPSEMISIKPSFFYQKVELENDDRFEPGRPKFQVSSVLPTPSSEELKIYGLEINAELDFADITSSTSYLEHDRNGELNMTGIPGAFGVGPDEGAPIENMHDRFGRTRFTQEVRVTSNDEGDFQWLVGGYYSDSQGTVTQDLSPDGLSDFVGGLPFGDNLFLKLEEPFSQQLAFFADVSYDISEKLTVEAGTRWFEYKVGVDRVGSGLFNGGDSETHIRTKDNGITSRVKAIYDATDDLLLYASISQGYRPGFAMEAPSSVCDDEFERNGDDVQTVRPDKMVAYEVGEKATLLDGRMTFNSAVYYNEWKDVQQSVGLPCGWDLVDNGGKAHSVGFEMEISAQPIDGLNLIAALSYVDAKLDGDVPSLAAVDGDTLVGTNKWQVYLDGTYMFPISENTEGYVHADFSYFSAMAFAYPAGMEGIPNLDGRDGYHQINLRAGVFLNDDLEIAIFATNITDELVNIGSTEFFSPLTQYTIRPRTIGLNVKVDF